MVRKAGAFLKKMVWACLNGEPDNNNEQQYNNRMMKQLNKLITEKTQSYGYNRYKKSNIKRW